MLSQRTSCTYTLTLSDVECTLMVSSVVDKRVRVLLFAKSCHMSAITGDVLCCIALLAL
jgi:hypothetical protein